MILISDKPLVPEGPIIVEALLRNSVIISWKPPKDDGGSLITNYIVEKREAKEGEKWNLVSSAVSGTTCRIPNLTESAGYYFRVSAQNQYGISESLEIPAVVIIKSPYGKLNLLISLSLNAKTLQNKEKYAIYILTLLFFRKTWNPTTANSNFIHKGFLCCGMETPIQ